jgi:hypothetical protein
MIICLLQTILYLTKAVSLELGYQLGWRFHPGDEHELVQT